MRWHSRRVGSKRRVDASRRSDCIRRERSTDMVAHSLASIALRPGVGVRVGTQDPQQGQEALAGIRRAAKDTLNELRATLGLMRTQEAKELRDPAPALSDLDRLVSEAADNGMEVRVELRGLPRPLPSALEISSSLLETT